MAAAEIAAPTRDDLALPAAGPLDVGNLKAWAFKRMFKAGDEFSKSADDRPLIGHSFVIEDHQKARNGLPAGYEYDADRGRLNLFLTLGGFIDHRPTVTIYRSEKDQPQEPIDDELGNRTWFVPKEVIEVHIKGLHRMVGSTSTDLVEKSISVDGSKARQAAQDMYVRYSGTLVAAKNGRPIQCESSVDWKPKPEIGKTENHTCEINADLKRIEVLSPSQGSLMDVRSVR